MLENQLTKLTQVQRREIWVERPDEVFVKPLRLLDLKTYPFYGLKLFSGKVNNKPNTQVIQPFRVSVPYVAHTTFSACWTAYPRH
jgi:hypothetical protein